MSDSNKQSLNYVVEHRILEDYFSNDDQQVPFLPPERELCERYQVSRITIREALCRLEVRGYVKRLHGKGIQCVNGSVDVVSDAIQTLIERNHLDYRRILEIRYMVEKQTARYAAIRSDEEDIKRLQACLQNMTNLRESYNEYLAADMQFHIHLSIASKNILLTSLVKALIPALQECIQRNTDHQMRLTTSYSFHTRILDAIIRKDPEEAEKQMMRHLITTETIIEDNYQKQLQASSGFDTFFPQ